MHAFQQARITRDKRFDGVFFVAVKSTGIFCRPVCPAVLPKEQNVTYYRLAEQAMGDGFRPCLRCRPDSAPGSCAWKGVDTTVERALSLLNAFPDLSLQQIAEKLGISDRYLRGLFQQHLGLSPKRYQLYQQLLFAKQLLHQTSLSIEQVAQAAGFQSARRLQDNVRQHLQLTPRQIRGKQEYTRPLELKLSFRPPYNWPQVRDFLALRAVPQMEWVEQDSYARTFRLDGRQGWFHARFDETNDCFVVKLEMQPLDNLKSVTDQIRRILDLDADMPVIGTALTNSGIAQPLLVPGLRLPGVWAPFEAGCRAILGQQVSVKAAIGLLTRLTDICGQPVDRGRLFPLPEAIADADLSSLGMPSSRRETLRRFAHYCLQHREHDPDALLNIKGIGPWTVSYIKLRGYSQPDIWLDSDLVIKKQIANYALQPDQAAPWRSYLTLQLWSM
ncbi:AlkA N-terminal domain-containing protein [Lacimicrobium alkaliphilum]|uniref:DNA-3-methyladenine glycosylase II n=1 Tax=Lacimicrobium alkaliphilum TaxID=1526571 RepID=A0ABQ1RUS4_9ALTE|nr:AlkA N-terminal domain-containing protein [Lacimicrobium alkaliphilum]GGD78963.1 3-methyladenine DNA glycosylase [Lacimicrobium alkaliphilum]